MSTSKPVGSPAASLSINPPWGSGVLEVILAKFKARVLTTTAWPSAHSNMTGLSLENTSISCFVGKRFSGYTLSIQPLPITQSPES